MFRYEPRSQKARENEAYEMAFFREFSGNSEIWGEWIDFICWVAFMERVFEKSIFRECWIVGGDFRGEKCVNSQVS